ncbi:hypothetical protein [Micromonospora sp. 067-2]|uniref:hypothetical protein n=1 Tax=Micromonospora sp. 067-2 TaxID=2789270 RepID=UPI00397840C1
MGQSEGSAVPAGQGGGSRWTPVASILIALAGLVVSIVGAVLLRRGDELGRLAGPPLLIVGQLGLAFAMQRATTARAEHFAAAGVPTEWTRPAVRGVTAVDLRRWDNTIRDLREPWPGDSKLSTAARARAEGLPFIVFPAVLSLVVAVVGVALGSAEPTSVSTVAGFPNIAIGLLLCVAAIRYVVDGRRARAYLARFPAPTS